MRTAWFVLALLVACGDRGEISQRPTDLDNKTGAPRIAAVAIAASETVVVDGASGDTVWSRARWTEVDVAAPVGKIKLKAAYDQKRFYLLALWNDNESSRNRYWKRTGVVKFERYDREDGLGILWAPGADAGAFQEAGCAMYCHSDTHAIVPKSSRARIIDVWYWGAQQTNAMRRLRDMALRGGADRLRGDRQPGISDNIPNRSTQFEGPKYFPMFVGANASRILLPKNLTEVKRFTLENKIRKVHGREVALDILRERRGSRGDVKAKGRHYKNKGWVVEMGRDLDTGQSDDQPLAVDPLVVYRFAVAVYDDAAPGQHATSGPIELVFVMEN